MGSGHGKELGLGVQLGVHGRKVAGNQKGGQGEGGAEIPSREPENHVAVPNPGSPVGGNSAPTRRNVGRWKIRPGPCLELLTSQSQELLQPACKKIVLLII